MSSFKVVIQKKRSLGKKKKKELWQFSYSGLNIILYQRQILMKTIQLIKTKTPISQEQKRNHTNSKHIYSLENL